MTLNNSTSHRIAGELRSDSWQHLVLDEGKQRHLCDWERREPKTSSVTHTATITLSFVISLVTTYKPMALNHHHMTETNA